MAADTKKPTDRRAVSAPKNSGASGAAGASGALPFALDEDEWESELAAWDAHLPALLGTERPDASATPRDENPFRETPTTVVSDVSALINEEEARQREFGGADRDAPASGVYASMVALDQDFDSPFRENPPPDPDPSLTADPLPEMAADAWRGDLRRLIAVKDVQAPPGPDAAYWARWSRLLTDELSIAGTASRRVDLTLAAARVAELGGDVPEALRLYDDALTLQPEEASALRARVRILESQGRWDGAIEALRRLVAATRGEERALSRIAGGVAAGTRRCAERGRPGRHSRRRGARARRGGGRAPPGRSRRRRLGVRDRRARDRRQGRVHHPGGGGAIQ
jgi:tetratricopeptide (TPR) repeat protein